jgi:hypothetical protein
MSLGLFYDCSIIGPDPVTFVAISGVSVWLQSLKASQQLMLFTGRGSQPYAQPPTWGTRVSVFVWIITFDPLPCMGDPTSSYATALIALGNI